MPGSKATVFISSNKEQAAHQSSSAAPDRVVGRHRAANVLVEGSQGSWKPMTGNGTLTQEKPRSRHALIAEV